MGWAFTLPCLMPHWEMWKTGAALASPDTVLGKWRQSRHDWLLRFRYEPQSAQFNADSEEEK
jgi:hypothetical protein